MIDGLQTSGRERQMVRVGSIQSLVKFSSVSLKMGGDMVNSSVSKLMDKGSL